MSGRRELRTRKITNSKILDCRSSRARHPDDPSILMQIAADESLPVKTTESTSLIFLHNICANFCGMRCFIERLCRNRNEAAGAGVDFFVGAAKGWILRTRTLAHSQHHTRSLVSVPFRTPQPKKNSSLDSPEAHVCQWSHGPDP